MKKRSRKKFIGLVPCAKGLARTPSSGMSRLEYISTVSYEPWGQKTRLSAGLRGLSRKINGVAVVGPAALAIIHAKFARLG